MNMSLSRRGICELVLVTVVIGAGAAGCQKSLFTDADPSTSWKLRRYYHNDSAVQTSEERKKASDMGFGFPMGGGEGSGGPGGY